MVLRLRTSAPCRVRRQRMIPPCCRRWSSFAARDRGSQCQASSPACCSTSRSHWPPPGGARLGKDAAAVSHPASEASAALTPTGQTARQRLPCPACRSTLGNFFISSSSRPAHGGSLRGALVQWLYFLLLAGAWRFGSATLWIETCRASSPPDRVARDPGPAATPGRWPPAARWTCMPGLGVGGISLTPGNIAIRPASGTLTHGTGGFYYSGSSGAASPGPFWRGPKGGGRRAAVGGGGATPPAPPATTLLAWSLLSLGLWPTLRPPHWGDATALAGALALAVLMAWRSGAVGARRPTASGALNSSTPTSPPRAQRGQRSD